nr:C-C motif chemokine 36.1 [Nerophis lumbriciformis]
MRSTQVFLLCTLAALMLTSVFCNNSSGPEECCFKHFPRRLHSRIFKTYFVTDNRCPIMSVILVTKKNNSICANPTLGWVKNIMRSLDDSNL